MDLLYRKILNEFDKLVFSVIFRNYHANHPKDCLKKRRKAIQTEGLWGSRARVEDSRQSSLHFVYNKVV